MTTAFPAHLQHGDDAEVDKTASREYMRRCGDDAEVDKTASREYMRRCLQVALLAKRHELVREIFAHPLVPRDLLAGDRLCLSYAIRGKQAKGGVEKAADLIWQSEPADLCETVQMLLDLGAKVNTRDPGGNKPIYHACVRGFARTLSCLVEWGADVFSRHNSIELSQMKDDNDDEGSEPVSLLQLALDVCYARDNSCRISDMSDQTIDEAWKPIILRLMDAGVRCDTTHPILLRLLHVACFQGDLACAERLLNVGVYYGALGPPSSSFPHQFGSALHAAVAGGQAGAIEFLLSRGFDGNTCCLNIIDGSREVLSPVGLACKRMGKRKFRVKGAFEVRIEAHFEDIGLGLCKGVLESDDKQMLLHEAAVRGSLPLLKLLSSQGERLEAVPLLCHNFQVVEELVRIGAAIDVPAMQHSAAQHGHQDLLESLVTQHGISDSIIENFWPLASAILADCHFSTLEYLLTESGQDINQVFPDSPGSGDTTNLLRRSISMKSLQAVEFVLNHGADPRCPGLSQSAIALYREIMSPGALGMFWPDDIRILRLLLSALPCYPLDVDGDLFGPSVPQTPLNELAQQLRRYRPDGMNMVQRAKKIQTVQEQYVNKHVYHVPDDDVILPFQYDPLLGKSCIRVLEIQPSEVAKSPIHCCLRQVDLRQRPDYEALSYVWGDASDSVRILVNGSWLNIGKNLWSALFRLRCKNKPRVVWADAVCINQSDNEERGQQVQIMHNIYRQASGVLVWVGEHAENSHYVVTSIDDGITDENEKQSPSPLEETLDWHNDENLIGDESEEKADGEAEREQEREQEDREEAFRRLLERPWFYRTWIIQEVLLNEYVMLLCGPHAISFQALGAQRHKHYGLMPPEGISNHWEKYEDLDGTALFRNLQTFPTRGHIEAPDLLSQSRQCLATDPRDKVYAILGLLEGELMRVDYTLSTAEVYRRFTQAVIEKDKSLDLLYHLGVHRNVAGLASWVPDYTSKSEPTISQPLNQLFPYDNSSERSTYWEFQGFNLVASGHYLDTILEIGEELARDPSTNLGEEKYFAAVFAGWESLATQLERKSLHTFISDVFLETLTADLRLPGSSPLAWPFYAWYLVYGTGTLLRADPRFFAIMEALSHCVVRPYTAEDMKEDVDAFFTEMKDAAYGRRFFITENGSMGLAPPSAQRGDQIISLVGGDKPFILRSGDQSRFSLVGHGYLHSVDPHCMADAEMTKFTLT
ncbi:hypothetical protein N7494_007694 [Penicillium frequentans]|uniref:Heterokaryon incompatibility domain-containing protein n=1 Tax=Penicillium frequentans TaxID=3151616 RepID=A0AAD6CTL7_9EURO|nr:hypothetical protein N7494_007694 [Penicillium glabrum]